MPDINATFKRPFAEQVAAYRLRLGDLVPTSRWDDLWQEAHDRAFMVAGATKADLLADLAAAVDKAIAQGTSLETFRADFRSIVERHGWHGWTGEGTQAGEAWRTRVIYRTNAKTSYAAGRFAQLTEAGFPFWVYKHGGSREPREVHLHVWDGLVLPVDHEFWKTHYPPNGWGCSCYVVGARSMAAARRLGGNTDKTLPPNWRTLDPKTGAPAGIDKGWAHAPGASVSQEIEALTAKPLNWDYTLAVAFMRSLPDDTRDRFTQGYRRLPSTADAFRRYGASAASPDQGASPDLKTLGLATGRQVEQIERLTGLEMKNSLWDFSVEWHQLRHIRSRHSDPGIEITRGQRAVDDSDFAMLPHLVDMPDRISLAGGDHRRGKLLQFERVMGAERYVALFDVRTGRRRLGLVTMWVERIAGTPPPSRP